VSGHHRQDAGVLLGGEIMSTVEERVSSARTNLILNSPFFGVLLLQMKMKEEKSLPTMATDGKSIIYNSDFVSKLTNLELRGVLVHEVYHCIMKHHFRLGDRNPKKANIAMDLAINPLIIEAGYTLPDGALIDPQYYNMNWERIYELLPDSAGEDGSGGGEGGIGDVLPAVGEDGGQPSEIDEVILDSSIIMAANAAKKAGKLPAGLEKLIEGILEPRVDWESILAQFVDSFAKADYSYRKLNRSMMQRGLVGPGLQSEEIGDALIVLDLSGSISNKEMSEQLAEVFGILDRYDVNLTLATADTNIYMVGQWERGDIPDPSDMVLRGGGGTSLARLNEWARENNLHPRFCIYMTDACVSDWGSEPDFPLLVGVLSSGSRDLVPSWAKVVDIL